MNIIIYIIGIFLILIILLLVYLNRPEIDQIDKSIFDYKIAFCFIIRDGEKYIKKNLKEIESLGKLFKDYRIFYLENDSKDNTINILFNAKKYNNKIIGESKKISNKYSIDMCKSMFDINCNKRTSFLGMLRQYVLDMSLKWDSDLTVMLDMDFVYFNKTDFLKMVTKMKKYKANAIFGMSYNNPFFNFYVPYDWGAVRDFYKLIPILFSNNLVKVKSAFSGFGVYNTKYIRNKNIKYDGRYDLEHISFNTQIDNVYVDPKFNPIYETSLYTHFFTKH